MSVFRQDDFAFRFMRELTPEVGDAVEDIHVQPRAHGRPAILRLELQALIGGQAQARRFGLGRYRAAEHERHLDAGPL